MTDGANILYCHHIGSRILSFVLNIYIRSWPLLKIQVKFMHISTANTLQTVTQCKHYYHQMVISRLTLHCALTHSQGQGQGKAHFDSEYLENDDRVNITIAIK